MSSRDRSDRPRRPDQNSGDALDNTNAQRPPADWDFDPDEIDRYLSGGSGRAKEPPLATSAEQQPTPPGRRTANSLEQLRRNRQQAQQAAQPTASQPPRPAPRRTVQRDASDLRGDSRYRVRTDPGEAPPPAASAPRPRTRPAAPAEPGDTLSSDTSVPDWGESPFDGEYGEAAPAAARTARVPRLTRPSISVPRPAELPRPAVPAFIRGADLANDATALGLIGLSLLSLAVMAILVANRLDMVASPFATHVNASGGLEQFEKNTAIWRLPLLSGMFFLMNLVAAWFISPTDRFLSRFLLGVSAAVQLVAWIALIHFLW